jgi:xanthine/uracil permease
MGLSLPEYFGQAVPADCALVDGAWTCAQTFPNRLGFEPRWLADILNTIGSSGMAVGAIIAMILDNTIPGSDEDRGLSAWSARRA